MRDSTSPLVLLVFLLAACGESSPSPPAGAHDAAPDGRFVMIREPAASVGVVYAENWFAELLAKVKR